MLTILIKEWMANLAFHLADIIDSDTLRADALHHRSDSFSSILVVVSLISVRFGFVILDGIMAIGVAGFMLFSGFPIARDEINDLLGTATSPEKIDKIRQLANSIENVYNLHDIIVHRYGIHNFISLHVEVDEKVTAEKLHAVADQVEKKIAHKLEAKVVTHVDPVVVRGETVENIRLIIQRELDICLPNGEVQDLRFVEDVEVESILFQVPIPLNYKEEIKLEDCIRKKLEEAYPKSEIRIDFVAQLA